MRVLLENTTFSRHKIVRDEGIIRIARIIRGRVLYEEIQYMALHFCQIGNLIRTEAQFVVFKLLWYNSGEIFFLYR